MFFYALFSVSDLFKNLDHKGMFFGGNKFDKKFSQDLGLIMSQHFSPSWSDIGYRTVQLKGEDDIGNTFYQANGISVPRPLEVPQTVAIF